MDTLIIVILDPQVKGNKNEIITCRERTIILALKSPLTLCLMHCVGMTASGELAMQILTNRCIESLGRQSQLSIL